MKRLMMFIFLISGTQGCTNEGTDGPLINRGDEKKPLYYLAVEAKDGDETAKTIEFMIDKSIVLDLKLPAEKIEAMCDDAALYADWNANFKKTYKHSNMASLSYEPKEKKIKAFMNGTAENAYGVPDKIFAIISFDLSGKMMVDKDDMPIVE